MSHSAPSTSDRLSGVTLRTLGGAGLLIDGEPEPILGPGKPFALLTYLALTPGRRSSREFLLDLLWADAEPERARNALRQVLFHLRRLLGEDALPGTAEVSLAAHLTSDRDLFLAAVERGELETAMERYGGEFLPAFGVPGGARFEQWADTERERLRAAFLRCAELLVRRHLDASRFRDAQRLARRARDEAPDAESAWRLLLETTVASRDFVAAAVEADALEQWAANHEVVVEPATRTAIARARQVSPAPGEASTGTGLVAELTGREREFAAITSAWDVARAGHARHVHLTAPAGLGKTRLLRDATARLRAAGAPVVWVRGAPGDREVPFALASDLALALAALPGAAGIAPASAAALTALAPQLSSLLTAAPDPASGDEALRRRIHAVADLVHAVADEQPFVLAIDDLHWADPASSQVLDGILPRLQGARVLCLTAARPERVPSGEAMQTFTLEPLTVAQVGSLVSALGALPHDAAWARDVVPLLCDATHGSPLLVLETLRLAMDVGCLSLVDGAWQCADEARLRAQLRAGEALRERVRVLPATHAWVLALLATAGTPLSVAQLAGSVDAAADLPGILATLEREGFVTRAGSAWTAAHDEIAAAGRAALDPGKRATAERTVGELLVHDPDLDALHLLRGAHHLVAAGESARVRQLFRRYVRLSRARRDRPLLAQLAADVLGPASEPGPVRDLVRSLPLHWRVGLWTRGRQAAAAMALVAIALAAVVVRNGRADVTGRPRLVYLDSVGTTRAVAVRTEDFDGRTAPVTPARAAALAPVTRWIGARPPAVSPDGRSVAWNQDAGDSTTIDIWIRTPAGTRRLTSHARDDVVTGWMPDGSALVGLTNRWSPPDEGNYDVALFDTATGAAHQVTRGPAHDGEPRVSPDGTRLVFNREPTELPYRICLTRVDGAGEPECRSLDLQAPVVVGWISDVELLLVTDSLGVRRLVRYDWARDARVVVAGPSVAWAFLSPDRKWVLASLRVPGLRGWHDWLIPLDRPAQARQVDPVGGAPVARWWEGVADTSTVIARLAFTDSTRDILPGVGSRLEVQALIAAGRSVPLRVPVDWRSSDTTIATVDSSGIVRARAHGHVTITASLAGWRTASREVDVRATEAHVVLDERWDPSWTTRWIRFGEPAPEVVPGPGRVSAFWNHGDGTWASMALLRQGWSAREGLGLEVRVSTPITRHDWQRLRTTLVAGIDPAALERADQRGAAPLPSTDDARCAAEYPGSGGAYGLGILRAGAGYSPALQVDSLRALLSSGTWWTLRLQLFPDGRCGVAVNGQPIWLSPEPVSLDREFRVRLGDESFGSRLLHGPLQLWTGVRTDIDWARPAPLPAPAPRREDEAAPPPGAGPTVRGNPAPASRLAPAPRGASRGTP